MMADRFAAQRQAPSGSLDEMTVQLGGNAGSLIGNALFGGRTSAMAEQAVLNEAIKESEVAEDPDERLKLFSAALRRRGLEGYAQKADMQLLNRQKTKASTSKIEADAKLERDLRAELGALPANATPEQIEGVVFKYGDPDKILTTLERRQARQQATEDRMAAARQAHEDRMELARQNNASREQIAAMNRQFEARVEQMRQDSKIQTAQDRQANKTLPASLQKSEDDDQSAIDTARGVIEDITPIISKLTPNPTTKKPELDLSRFNNIKFQTQAFFGSDDPEVQNYQELERNLTRFVNESLRLNKGVQTEGDAQRAANEVQAAFSKGNTSSMRRALEELKKINERASNNRKAQVDRRREAQGVTPLYSKGTSRSGGSVLDEADAIINRK